MNVFEKKYGINEDKKIKDFHKARRMFCIWNNKLHIAKPNLPYSHAVWFEKEGMITKDNDFLMDEIVRGYVDSNGDIYFYVGYDFRVDENAEKEIFSYLEELVEKLNIKTTANIFGGKERDKQSGELLPIKEYGQVSKYI